MEFQIYKYLCNCNELIEFIGGPNHIYPIFARSTQGINIEYSFRDIKSEIVTQALFELNIIGSNYDDLIRTKEILNNNLNFKLRDYYINLGNYKVNIGLGGGSTPLYNQDMNLYFINLTYIINYIEIEE